MTRYHVDLTGEYEGRILADCANVRLTLPDGATVTVPVELATEVQPPLPEEPPKGFTGRAGGQLWERDDALFVDGSARRWYRTGEEKAYTWAEAWDAMRGAPLIALVPDPAADAPTLPWRKPSYDDRYPDLIVDRARDAGDVLEINGVGLAANQICDKGEPIIHRAEARATRDTRETR